MTGRTKKSPGKTGHHERRLHRRVSLSRPTLFQSDIYPKPRMGFTTDLSLGGARIEDASSLYGQETLSMWFSLEPRVISCRARVVHIQQTGDRYSAGIRFESMDEKDRTVLDEYLSHFANEDDPP